MRWKKKPERILGVILFLIFYLSFTYPIVISTISDPSLTEVLDYLGFSNINETRIETFVPGSYNITLYAKFSEQCDEDELSFYEVNSSIFDVIFTGSEGRPGYLDPPLSRIVDARFQFGLSVLWLSGEGEFNQYFTETWRNPDKEQNARVFENLDDPGMFLVGFRDRNETENHYYNGIVLSIEPREIIRDLNEDGTFNMRDISIFARNFGNEEGDPHWNPYTDLTGTQGPPDGIVDIRDVALTAKYFGKEFPVATFECSLPCPVVNETVTFDASLSSDPDGSISTYHWDFGDGEAITTDDPVITHIFRKANSTVNYTVTLMIIDDACLTNSIYAILPVTNPSILRVSLPFGEDRTGIFDPDPWLNECWLLNITGALRTFQLKVEDISKCIPSYDTHLVVALNDAAYNNLVNLTLNNITLVKNDFRYGILRPYDLWDWPPGDVYPTWHNDTLVSLGTICPKRHKNVTISIALSDVRNARIHFDAYGSKCPCPIPPIKKCYITYNSLSEDSTILFSPPPICQLTINASTGGTTVPTPGTYTYDCNNFVSVTAIPDNCYQFDHWKLDGVDIGSENPYSVIMDTNHSIDAIFEYSPPPLSVSIDPLTSSVLIGEPVFFTSTTNGGLPPYNYQWYLNENPVLGGNKSSWVFTPNSTGTYYVYLKVTDLCNSTAQSETAKISVIITPVGGYSISLNKPPTCKHLICYTLFLAIFTAVFYLFRKRVYDNARLLSKTVGN